MMIGVISDTHLRSPDGILERVLTEIFADADMILHAGDIVSRKVLDRLEERGVLAVCGNMDDYEVGEAIPQVRIVPADGKRIGLIHGWGSKEGLAQRILARFKDTVPDLIVYGHSHEPSWATVRGVPMFNPGSANPRGYGRATVGLIEISDDKIDGRFVSVEP